MTISGVTSELLFRRPNLEVVAPAWSRAVTALLTENTTLRLDAFHGRRAPASPAWMSTTGLPLDEDCAGSPAFPALGKVQCEGVSDTPETGFDVTVDRRFHRVPSDLVWPRAGDTGINICVGRRAMRGGHGDSFECPAGRLVARVQGTAIRVMMPAKSSQSAGAISCPMPG